LPPATDNRCLAIAYVNARAIMDRLDDVLTPAGWQDEYQALADGAVLCRLSLKLDGEWVVKCDVGGQSEQPDEGDRVKAAFSDALKRAAVKFGIGRYLYRLPRSWVDYDPKTKQITKAPRLPDWATAGAKSTDLPKSAPAPLPRAANGAEPVRAPVPRATPDQLHLLLEFADHFCWEPDMIRERLRKAYQADHFDGLARDQAQHLIEGLVTKYGSPEQWGQNAEADEERAAIQQEGVRS
jgi:hypothetical protein